MMTKIQHCYSNVASLGRAIDIADACSKVWDERWIVIRAPHEFQVVPDRPGFHTRGDVAYETQS